MGIKKKKWEWSVNKEAAAVLLAEDSLTNAQIIKKVGTSASTMDRWRKAPEFQTRIDENITAFRARVIECGLPREKSRPAATDKSGTSSEMKSVGRGSSGLVMENPSNWVWSKEKEAAAELLAADSFSIPQIAQKIGTSESTIDRWKKVPEFQARIHETIAAFRAKALECGLARKQRRIATLSDLIDRLLLIMTERGASPEMKSVPGGWTGLIKVTWKQLGTGDQRRLVPEYRSDTALSAEIRLTLKQVAREVRKYS